MKKTDTRRDHRPYNLVLLFLLSSFAFFACTPEGVINKTKYQGEKITNTCETFAEEIEALASANGDPAALNVAEYDNSDFEDYHLDPGQWEIKDGMLNFRFSGDLEYEKYLTKGVAIHVMASFSSMDHLAGMENPTQGEAGMLIVDRAYYDAHKNPSFMYSIPIQGISDSDLNGKQISVSFAVAKYNKKGKLKKVFCNSMEVPLGPVSPACCTYQPFDKAAPQSVISMPDVRIEDETYRYRGFTGTLDLIFPENSTKFDKELLSEAIQDYIKKYQELGYQVSSINLEGYASLGGKEGFNQNLSEKRAEAVKNDLMASLNDSTIAVTSAGMGEDWNRLVLLTKASALDGQQQQEVLSIANQGISNDEKEAEMRKLAFWEKLIDEVIVNTRHTFVTFKFNYQPDKMYVEDYPSQMPVISDELIKVAGKTMNISKWKEGENAKKGLRTLDILLGNNKKSNLYAMRSTYHFGLADVRSAITDIEQARALDRGNTQYALAALAYKTKYADSYSLSERMDMLNEYNDYVVKYPDNKGLFFNRAVMMDKVGYISGAMAEYAELLEGGEPTASNLNNRGVAKLKTMRITGAEADFIAALDKDSELAVAYYNLALIYAYKGLTNKTVEHLDKAVMYDSELKGGIFSNPAFSVMKDTPKFDKYR